MSTSYSYLILKPKKERAVINRHPWIFSGAVAQLPKADDGDIVGVKDASGKLLAYGFFNSNSQIVCRLFEFSDQDLSFDQEYWTGKISRAIKLRQSILNNANTNCFRLLHAEGDFFPGIIADVYDKAVVLQILIKGTEKILPFIKEALIINGLEHIYLKTKTSSQLIENIVEGKGWLNGGMEMPVKVQENSIPFDVDFEKGQKTGFFLDQRENRNLVKSLSKDKKVLNTFSYTGGFSLYALSGGASWVDSVDVSKDAIRACNEMVEESGHKNHAGIVADCFDYLKSMDQSYDLIILDPPAFAKSAKSVPNAARGYKELNLLAFRKIKSGGLLFTFSCSQNVGRELFQKIIFGAAADARRNIRILQHLTQPFDHPVNIYHPEGEYLKGLLLWVE